MHLWKSRTQEKSARDWSVLEGDFTGDIAVVIDGEHLDFHLVSLGCEMTKRVRRKIHFVHVIEVPRALPLKAVLTQEAERADTLLNIAMQIAKRVGAEALAEIVQTRAAGPAIVDEAKDHHCALILISFKRSTCPNTLSKAVPYVLANAPCRVWLVQDNKST